MGLEVSYNENRTAALRAEQTNGYALLKATMEAEEAESMVCVDRHILFSTHSASSPESSLSLPP